MVEVKTKKETRKIGDWDIKVEVWKRQARGDKISAIYRYFQIYAGEKGYPNYAPDRETIKNVCEKLLKLLPEQIRLLPQEIQAFACEHKVGLKEKLESLQGGKIPEAVPKELIPKIEELARRLQLLIYVPEPERPLLTDAQRKGNADFSLKATRTILNAFWWCTDPSVYVYLELNIEQQGLFDRFINLATSQGFKTIYNDWESAANRYLALVRSGGDEKQVRVASQEAECLMHNTHDELWKAVDALRWPS